MLRKRSLTSVLSYEDNTSPHVVRPVIYVFAPVLHSFNSMVVRSQTASIPLYHIAVRMNCFIPSSYITVITRGDTVEGEEVGQFEYVVSELVFNYNHNS